LKEEMSSTELRAKGLEPCPTHTRKNKVALRSFLEEILFSCSLPKQGLLTISILLARRQLLLYASTTAWQYTESFQTEASHVLSSTFHPVKEAEHAFLLQGFLKFRPVQNVTALHQTCSSTH
jgi:hypothetical protein